MDHWKDAMAYTLDQGWKQTHSSKRTRQKTTKGWQLLVSWKDGTTDWVPLKELKASNPIELVEYAAANEISEEPAFAWWVKDVPWKQNQIVAKIKSRYWKMTHKFGLKLPHSVQEALQIDEETGTDCWRHVIEKEIKNVMPAFEKWDDGTIEDIQNGKKLVGYQEVFYHIVFDIKVNFTS